jgi:hypothetical protein
LARGIVDELLALYAVQRDIGIGERLADRILENRVLGVFVYSICTGERDGETGQRRIVDGVSIQPLLRGMLDRRDVAYE